MAQIASSFDVSVSCAGNGSVDGQTLEILCKGLTQALTAKFPGTRFVPTDGSSSAHAFVALETFTASKSSLQARLKWQNKGAGVISGPRLGFSIVDKDITPAMQLNFINRLVQDTELSF